MDVEKFSLSKAREKTKTEIVQPALNNAFSSGINKGQGATSFCGRLQMVRTSRITSPEETDGAKQRPRRSLLSLCVGVLGRHLEDLMGEIDTIAQVFPAEVKMMLLAIARRRGLLDDDLLLALADRSWEILDVSGSDVTDNGMNGVVVLCPLLKVVDISCCSKLSPLCFRAMVEHCTLLHTLRCGGTALSNATARRSLCYIIPSLDEDNEVEESWEDLEKKQVGRGAPALRWLVWPSVDRESLQRFSSECPRLVVNPVASSSNRFLNPIPQEALPDTTLDDAVVKNIDPGIWATKASISSSFTSSSNTSLGGLSIAERFRMAFAERDERLASKRAKNMRQNQRRADKAWLESDANAKALFWAGFAQKSLKRL